MRGDLVYFMSRSDELVDVKSRYITLMDDFYNEHRLGIEETPLMPLDGFPGYFVDYCGNVIKNTDSGLRFIKPWKGKNGYLYVSLVDENGDKKNILIHRLIAEAFVDNEEGYPFVRHYDDCKLNNSVSNLVWGTQRDNHNDMVRNGHEFRKAVYCYETDTVYYSGAVAADNLGCSKSAITLACKGKNRTANGYHVCYEIDMEEKLSNLSEWLKPYKYINVVYARKLGTDDVLEFDNYTEVANYIGCSVSLVSMAMHGKTKSCKGWLIW